MPDKETDISVDGDRYVVKLEGLELASFANQDDAVIRKTEIDKAIKLDEAKKIPESTLQHCTGWKYTGQISLPPELFVNEDEIEKDFLTKIGILENKLTIVEIG